LADAREWYRAAEVWDKIAQRASSQEAAGKATFNMAVAAEVEGRLEKALQLAKEAYTKYGLKKAKTYIQTLEQRLEDAETVRRQMNQPTKS
jgi:ribosomal protein L7/L12